MGDYMSDLDAYIKEWVWQHRLKERYTNRWREYVFSDLIFDVDMKKVRYSSDKPEFSNQRRIPLSNANVVFKSNYTNNTDVAQEVNIKAKRTTSATAKARMKHGFTSDDGVGVKIRVPNDVVGKFDGEVDVDADDEERAEQKMSWTFNTKITAPPRKTTVARFEVNEERLSCDFSTYLHMTGSITVKVLHRETREQLTEVTASVKNILDEYLPKADEFSPRKNMVHLETKSARWPFRGTIDFQYGISQNEVIE